MSQPTIRRMTPDQFASLLVSVHPTLSRNVDGIHLHHTWRPTQAQFRGRATIEAMRRYHLGLGWQDIAQHLTVDPAGYVWTGRNWNLPPASEAGKNGTASSGPFMIEIVGDFDAGHDVLHGAQRRAVCSVVAALLQTCGLTTADVRFHNELNSNRKTCPGTGLDKNALLREVNDQPAVAARVATSARPSGKAEKADDSRADASTLPLPLNFLVSRDVADDVDAVPGFDDSGISEDGVAARALAATTATGAHDAVELGVVLGRTASEWAELRPHVINLREGLLSRGGAFTMDDQSIADIITGLRDYALTVEKPRLMIHAHGGLVPERSALQYAKGARQWWLDHGVYPVYFIWETSAWEVLLGKLGIGRGLGDARDGLFEAFARHAARWQWSEMKEYARLASHVDARDGEPGGARVFAQALRDALITHSSADLELHLVGHSAGAILLAHWLSPLVDEGGLTVESLSFLAPAVRTDLFKQLVEPKVGTTVRRYAQFGMDVEAELDDDLIEFGFDIYGKSLLYLVSNAFEPESEAAILGLEERFKEDAALRTFLESQRLELSRARGKAHNPATHARKHGCFDNDCATMRSVLEIVTGVTSTVPFPVRDTKCDDAARRSLARADNTWVAAGAWSQPSERFGVLPARRAIRGRALCVGIDSYLTQPLAGCVRDAEAWSSALSGMGFDVTTILDGSATRQRVLEGLRTLVSTASAGDLLVFQYSGHGTQAIDLNGDERDRYDEALVPVDYTSGALLLDDDLAEIYRTLPDGAVLTLFMDCCHAGTNSRFSPLDRSGPRGDERRRFLPLSPDIEEAHRRFRARTASPPPTTPEESLPGIVHFAACLDNQYAYESSGQGHFTRAALSLLPNAVNTARTNEAFAATVAADVIAIGRPQTPRLMRLPQGLEGRPLLGGASTGAGPESGWPAAFQAPGPSMNAFDDRAMTAWCLQSFEAGAEHWRRRLGR